MDLPDLGDRAEAWSVCVLDADSGEELAASAPERQLSTASVAKLAVLVELARRLEDGSLDPATRLDRHDVAPVGDSGLWQHLEVDRLPVTDVAALVGAVSDNLATNALIDLLGLDQVRDTARALAPGGSMLHDVVRDRRGAEDPPRLSTGCARDWAAFFAALHRREVVSDAVSGRVLGWTSISTDLSMVAAALDLDPLSHVESAEGSGDDVRLWNKTGTDLGVRCDVGLVTGAGRALAYAVLCNWDDVGARSSRRAVRRTMLEIGAGLREHLEQG